jgi:hypothetical protein
LKYKTREQLSKLKGIVFTVDGSAELKGTWWRISPEDFGKPVQKELKKYLPKWAVQ